MPDIMWDAPASPDEVTFAIRQIPLRSELVLSSLANITYSESHTVRWGEVTRRNRLAKYRAFDGPVAKSARDDAADRAAPFAAILARVRAVLRRAEWGAADAVAAPGAALDGWRDAPAMIVDLLPRRRAAARISSSLAN